MHPQQRQDTNKWFLSQQSRQKRNKIKLRIFTVMFRFPNHTLKLKAPDQPQSEGEEVFWQVILHSSCAMLCVGFSSKSKTIYVFPKQILKSKALDQSNQARKKLFCHVIVKNYLSNVSWKFSIKIESMWRREIKEEAPQLTLLYRGRTVRSSHRRCCIRKLFLEILQYPQDTDLCWSLFF